MANKRLKEAMSKAQVSADEMAEHAGVDLKTAERWIAGRTNPHPRSRRLIADLLGEETYVLWPNAEAPLTGTDVTAELIAAYPHRAEMPRERWATLFDQAESQIDLLGYAIQHLPEQLPGLASTLAEKAKNGCSIRIALADPDSQSVEQRDAEEGLGGALAGRVRTGLKHFGPLSPCEGAEIRLHSAPMYNSVFRFDNELLVTPHLFALPGYAAPLLHLRRHGTNGLFDGFAGHFERIWAATDPA